MGNQRLATTANGRRVHIASYQETFDDVPQDWDEVPTRATTPEAEETTSAPLTPAASHQPLRSHFPGEGTDYQGGSSDGYVYCTTFAGSKLEQTYEMVREFLREEGYGELPLPRDVDELLLFRIPQRRGQVQLFGDPGYVHNPIKILFPDDRRKRSQLILHIHNEQHPDHLIRFHGLEDRQRAATVVPSHQD